MTLAKMIAVLGIAAMAGALAHGFLAGDFFGEGRQLAAMPWGIVSLVDLYTGFTLFSCWIVYRERSLGVAAAWTLAMMGLGFFAGSVYALLALRASQGDWRRFWLGARA
jgi:hypothetical protein